MKTRKLNKKLGLSKRTIANLNRNDLLKARGGQVPTTWTQGETHCDYNCDTYQESCTSCTCPTFSCGHQTFAPEFATCDTWCQ